MVSCARVFARLQDLDVGLHDVLYLSHLRGDQHVRPADREILRL